jgi:hypothetical protein
MSLAGLIVATIGILGFFYVSFAYFGYQGNGMDWIYPTGGLFAILWVVSAAGIVRSLIRFLMDDY